uniref:Dishevelled binding antagonist of beta catenin 3 n=1 Tax=Chelonoidis abingdonii TaxID=106734 RepID=A0A8C0IU37_CHEAB
MIRAFSFPVSPERGRLRGWLEGSLAGLCELHLLRERQERRVRQALRLGTEPAPVAGLLLTSRPSLVPFQDALPGLMWELEQQVGGLRLSQLTSLAGFYEGASSAMASDSPVSGFGDSSGFPSVSGSCSRIGQAESRGSYASERPKSVGDGKDSAGRGMVPRSYSAPYSSCQDYPSEPPPRLPPRDSLDPFLYPSPLHAVAMQNPLLHGRLYDATPFSPGLAYGADYISRLIRRRSQLARGGKPRTSLNAEPPAKAVARQNSLCKRPSELLAPQAERKHPPAMERGSSTPSPCGYEGGAGAAARIWSSWDAAPPEAPQAAGAGPPPDGACQMVKAQYIPAQQPPRAQQAHRGAKKKPPPLTKGRSMELSPERAPVTPRERSRAAAMPKKCRFTEEGGEVPGGRRASARKCSPRGKNAARSQSENSLLNKPGSLGTKYHTVERDEVVLKPSRQRRPHPGAAGYRKWRSTAEICQEEAGAGEPRAGDVARQWGGWDLVRGAGLLGWVSWALVGGWAAVGALGSGGGLGCSRGGCGEGPAALMLDSSPLSWPAQSQTHQPLGLCALHAGAGGGATGLWDPRSPPPTPSTGGQGWGAVPDLCVRAGGAPFLGTRCLDPKAGRIHCNWLI